ncbi:xanthine/uracil permease [Entomoplasma ellychniae]|uniref:Xanthine/uracil permease n=1 Tax=Entomoplasma ellychniae TaxID=2114 RepID=A0A8E2QVD0_9MOLU|nr:NCS2 family permease [Entomoplasma ellychniae]PPE04371.1 xanthine/uracil permease [Entomoplasma ellychniae]
MNNSLDQELEFEVKSKAQKEETKISNNPIARFFKFNDLQTTFKKEIIGGVSTFLAMVYILSVEPNILKSSPSIVEGESNMNFDGIFLATALVVFLATMTQALWSRAPIALAPSMGLNAMFTYNVAGAGLGFEGAMLCVMLSSAFFTLIAITPVRKIIVGSMPESLKLIIGVGVGFFIAYVGFNSMGFFKVEGGLPVAEMGHILTYYPAMIIGLIVLIGSIILYKKGNIAPIAIMILCGLVVSVILGSTLKSEAFEKSFGSANIKNLKWDFIVLFNGFGSNIKNAYNQMGNNEIWSNPTFYLSIVILAMLNFFDATATITTIAKQVEVINNKEYKIPNSALILDAASGVVGGGIGTSHVGSFIESAVGVSQGAKSGFANIITALLFLIAIPLYPIFKMVPSCVTGAAAAFIGVLMINSIREIEWEKPEFALAGVFGILFMITTFNIANGIAFAFIFYTVGLISTGRTKEVSITVWVLDVTFIIYFIGLAFIQIN